MMRFFRIGLLSLAPLVVVLAAFSACSSTDTGAEATEHEAGASSSGSGSGTDPTRGDAGRDAGGQQPTRDGGDSDGAPQPDVAPPQLACLAAHFAGTVVDLDEVTDAGHVDGGTYDAGSDDGQPLEPAHAPSHWGLLLPSGTVLPWDDGRAKSYDHTLADPDLQDTLIMPYTPGAITPVNTENDDPGRIRSEPLFKAAYGASKTQVAAKIDDVDFVGQSVEFHERAAAALSRVSDRLNELIAADPTMAKYVTGELGGTYEWRVIANTDRLSVHSFGAAIDIRVMYSRYWEWDGDDFTWDNDIPQAVVDAFEAEQFVWGGRWYHYDTMHFEYRPELFDPACAL